MKPWLQLLAMQDSEARNFVVSGAGNFNKRHKVMLRVLGQLEGNQQGQKSFQGYFGDSQEAALAVLL